MAPTKKTIKKPVKNGAVKSIVKKRDDQYNAGTVAANSSTSWVSGLTAGSMARKLWSWVRQPSSSSGGMRGHESTQKAKKSNRDMKGIEEPAALIPCSICFESCVRNSPVSTKCGHLFCEGCLKSWLKKKKTCPSCEGKLVGKTAFHKIFP